MISAIVQVSNLYRHLRIDAEYYKPEYLSIEKQLKRRTDICPLRKVCHYIKKGIFDISPELYVKSGIPLIRTSEIKSQLVNFVTTVFLDHGTHCEHQKTELRKGDIVLTKIGAYIGDVALLPSKYEFYNFSQNVTGLKIKRNMISARYLLAYLLSTYGKSQIMRCVMLSGQGKIELEDIRDLIVITLSKEFQIEIELIVQKAEDAILMSEEMYQAAENRLLSELGLVGWGAKHHLSFVRKYSDAQQAGRIDAEYYQPKYEEIDKAIKKYKGGWDTLGALVTVKKCVEVGSGEYLDDGVPFIRVSNLSPFELTEEKYISEELYSEIKQHQPAKGEILFSKDGTPGRAYYLHEQPKKMIPSGGILRLKSKTDKINNEYLTLVLNSMLTKEQVNRDVGGSVILHWRPDQVKETVIPILPEEKQIQIQQKITESFTLRKQSKHLLECAKKAVEMAIEQDEKTALQWLNNSIPPLE